MKSNKETLKTVGEKFITCLKSMSSKLHSNILIIKITVFKLLILMMNTLNMKFHLINGILNHQQKNPFLNCKAFRILQDNLIKEILKNWKVSTLRLKELKTTKNQLKKYWINWISCKVQVNYKEKLRNNLMKKRALYRFWSNSDKEKDQHLFKRKANTWWFKIFHQKRKLEVQIH